MNLGTTSWDTMVVIWWGMVVVFGVFGIGVIFSWIITALGDHSQRKWLKENRPFTMDDCNPDQMIDAESEAWEGQARYRVAQHDRGEL